MKNLEKYLTLLNDEVDGLLLTSRYSRHYGAEYDIAEGAAVVTKNGCRYFTDSRYIEAAQNGLKGFEVLEINRENSYIKRINEAIEAVAKFEAMYAEYALNPDITKARMYYEAISQILPGVKVYINTGNGSSVEMLLPLESLIGGN